ncbi:hypothetical protein BHE90_011218 [Fusarium euwallaceae]|uniref:Fungal N-terminal domain-containing protein n=1 Tax=Fusarium euwallaceae TaxID=1147111 RepID=A0A430LF35_9HYPO|nr:hypothetical protein BHE90_011218 [Fusarium euwallaceae]
MLPCHLGDEVVISICLLLQPHAKSQCLQMEPLEIVGATAAIAQLLKLAIDIGDQARQLVQSFVQAPKELTELSAKIDRLGLLLHHANELDKDLANANASDLIPDAHNSLLYSCLGVSLAALEKVRMLHGDGGQSSASHRLRWAAIDKRRAQKVLKDVKESEAALDTVLGILSVRIASFNRASIAAVRLGQEAIRNDIISATQELESCFHIQSGLLGTKVEEASATTCDAIERVRREQQTTSIMFTEMMTRVLDSQERTEVRITETQAQMALQLSSLKATCHPSAQQTSLSRTPRIVTTEPSRFRSPTRASSSSPESSTTDIPDEIFAQVKARTEEWRWKEPLATQNWTFRTKAGAQDADDREGRLEGSLSLTSKKNLWKARALFKARVNILGRRIIFLEIEAQQFTQTWLGMPFLSGQISIVNVRPNNAPIFKACADFNLPMVKHLLETGEASIHDVNEYGEGLLECVLMYWESIRLLQFLLEQGCNPNVFHGTVNLPAVLGALELGQDEILSLFLFHGAQLEGFAQHPVSCLDTPFFSRQVKFLRSIGLSDWNPDTDWNNFLQGALWAGDIAELLFGLEEVKLDPNAQWKPLLSHRKLNVFMASLLVEFDTQVNPQILPRGQKDMPLNACIKNENSEVMHWLLSRDAKTTLGGYGSLSTWQTAWMSATRSRVKKRRDTVNFIELEGILSHLLWHNSDAHATFQHDISWEYTQQYLVSSSTRAQEVARAYSYCYREPVLEANGWKPDLASLRFYQEEFERSDQLRVPDFLTSWSANGILRGEPYHSDDGWEYDSIVSTDSWSGEEDCFTDEEPELDEEQSFQHTTLFYETISTEEGRRQLARFPLVRLLVNALQLAGYRAVMDDDGDVWYDNDDGDRYFDAREYQPKEGVDDGLVANCPICQDPEKYGLGHVFAEAERAREFLREYRRKKAEEKRRQRW